MAIGRWILALGQSKGDEKKSVAVGRWILVIGQSKPRRDAHSRPRGHREMSDRLRPSSSPFVTSTVTGAETHERRDTAGRRLQPRRVPTPASGRGVFVEILTTDLNGISLI